MRKAVSSIPDGIYNFTDFLDDDGLENSPVKIMVKLSVKGEKVRLDFTGTSPQVAGSVNAVRSITLSAVLYVFRSLLDEGMPTNSGSFRPLEVITPPGSLVNAQFPAAVAGGNVETSQRIVDVLLGALAQAVPERNVIIRKDKREEMPGKFSSLLTKGDVLRIETPGGGGWGKGRNMME